MLEHRIWILERAILHYCEVRDGEVIDRTSVQRLDQLKSRIGPDSPPARVAF